MDKIFALQKKNEKLAIGLISGTSLDGVDAALVKISGSGLTTKIKLENFLTYPYPGGLKDKILECSKPGGGTVDEICSLNSLLGEIFSEAALNLMKEARIKNNQVDFIGSHGQTIQHLPEPKALYNYNIISTLQIGEPAVIAERTGVLTIADFRTADMAAGGQGAPLVPYFDYLMFRTQEKNRALLNIGGIANFTVLPANCNLTDVVAFDTGPGNMILDLLMQLLFKRSFDKNGDIANRGKVSEKVLHEMMSHPFFELKPPKSTGREMFGKEYAMEFIKTARTANLCDEDIITTAAEFTVRSIWKTFERNYSNEKWHEIIVSGGGAKNMYIMQRLQQFAGKILIKTSDDFGVPFDAKEAMCFAVLANETIYGNPANIPCATGAKYPVILGKVCFNGQLS